ncbi:MAG: aspartate carbamoyltransferase catalytic subunit [Deltaproteobacteria bacterium]|nr:aspartate carbamoyltransferase catalytic subunit [Deltaproteobacteria bacterium]
MFTHRHLLGLEGLSREEILYLIDTAGTFKEISDREIKKVPTLRGKTVVGLFYEASTRTRTSFEIAAKRLSADYVNISASTSSSTKGETLLDTARNIAAMRPDALVMRHASAGAAHFLAQRIECPVINAGDGAHEHPTQALLDLLTIRDKIGRLEDLTVAIVGDILHSRVTRSNIHALRALGNRVRLIGPPTLLPSEAAAWGEVHHDLRTGLRDVDVVMMLRLQRERQGRNYLPSLDEYSRYFCLNRAALDCARPEAVVMHPGPINRGVEIASDVADGAASLIMQQVTNGVAVRMAVLFLLVNRVRAAGLDLTQPEQQAAPERRRKAS